MAYIDLLPLVRRRPIVAMKHHRAPRTRRRRRVRHGWTLAGRVGGRRMVHRLSPFRWARKIARRQMGPVRLMD